MRALRFILLLGLATSIAHAHDIPNARVDRAIQVELRPSVVEVIYEVSLAELTLTQDLRSLIGSLPEGDRSAWFQRYGEETAPLNARGLVLAVDGEPVDLEPRGFTIAVEEHPRFTFRFEAPLPRSGSLRLIDTNYAASEGASRLAARSRGALAITGADRPNDVHAIPIKPAWQLTPDDERRGKRVDLRFGPGETREEPVTPAVKVRAAPTGLAGLLDRQGGVSWLMLGAIAYALGIVHAIQPGHGKMIVAAGSVGPGGRTARAVALALITTSAHMASVVGLAALLWITGATDYPGWNAAILHAAGFVLAAIGLFRLGQAVNRSRPAEHAATPRRGGILAIGLAAGALPCWDAIGMLVLAMALRRPALGLGLVAAFSLGMATVLVAVGALAVGISGRVARSASWSLGLRIAGAVVLATIGGAFLTS